MLIILAENLHDSESDKHNYNSDYYKYFTDWDNEPKHRQNRPIVTSIDTEDTCIRYLKQEIHDWLVSYKISYSLKYRVHKKFKIVDMWGIDIPDENMAMLFKLTWI